MEVITRFMTAVSGAERNKGRRRLKDHQGPLITDIPGVSRHAKIRVGEFAPASQTRGSNRITGSS